MIVSQASAGFRLAEVIELQLALDEARAVRSRRVHLTALLSLPLAVGALWPSLLSEVALRAVVTFWAFSAIAAAWALVVERAAAAQSRSVTLATRRSSVVRRSGEKAARATSSTAGNPLGPVIPPRPEK